MENKSGRLSDVDISSVTLKELVAFIDQIKDEFPIAVRVLTKRLLNQELGLKPEDQLGDMTRVNMNQSDDRIIQSFNLLQEEMRKHSRNQNQTILVLSLHSTFGFGKKRILRLWGEAETQFGDNPPNVDDLIKWCKQRGITFDTETGIGTAN